MKEAEPILDVTDCEYMNIRYLYTKDARRKSDDDFNKNVQYMKATEFQTQSSLRNLNL